MSNPRIRVVLGGQSFDLDDGRTYLLGSDPGADIRVVHGSVAPQHARLTARDGSLEVVAVEATAVLRVAGQELRSGKLTPPLELSVGVLPARVLAVGGALIAAKGARPGSHEETFQEIMARELSRAPWFLLSVALHALLFLLLNWLVVTKPPGQGQVAVVQMLQTEPEADIQLETPEEEKVEIERELQEEAASEPEPDMRLEPEPEPEPAFEVEADSFDVVGLSAKLNRKGSGGGGSSGEDIFNLGSAALRKGSLRGTVAKLRETGFEIVFVFDSTGSMEGVLSGAKQRIFRFVEVLHALVPSARIGIVTYRDRGKAEEYLTRAVDVTHDVYRVMNFMHTVDAGGGGDFEEAVLDGLKAAFTQKWLPKSQRVVVLIGDAPPHKQDESPLRSLLQNFVRERAVVHTLGTMRAARGSDLSGDAKRAFESLQGIAKLGKGQAALLEQDEAVLREVLSMAFGSENRRDLDEVFELVDKRTQRTAVEALDAVQRGDLASIERGLRKNPVDDEYVKALIKLGTPATTRFLVEKLADEGFPPHARQAAAFAVMQILRLHDPPLDPEVDQVLSRQHMERLLRRLPR